MLLVIQNADIYGKKQDIIIENGIVVKISSTSIKTAAGRYLDVGGKTVLPAFVDIHTHLREPGYESKETIATGALAAVAGGYSAICAMPNTKPVCDNPYIVKYVLDRALEANLCRVYPIGAVTRGQEGRELAEIMKMRDAGAVAVSDDGMPVSDAEVMRIALEYAHSAGIPVISHSEELSLSSGGTMNEGTVSCELGLRGITRAAEEVAVARETLLAAATGTRVHIAHISTEGSVRIVREAKAAGIAVTAETCPHYFAGTDELCRGYNANAKVNPPLRTERDRVSIIQGLADGTIDCIATDHAPHTTADKGECFQSAANGISGLETAYALGYTYLVKSGALSLKRLSELMSASPSKILGLPCGALEAGAIADLVVVNNNEKYIVDPSKFKSKGKNTPFAGLEVFGRVCHTIVGGEIKYNYGE